MNNSENYGSKACANADSVSKKPSTGYGFVRTAVAVPVADEPEDEQVPVGTTDGGAVFRCLRASYYKVGLYNITVKGYPGVLVPVKKD